MDTATLDRRGDCDPECAVKFSDVSLCQVFEHIATRYEWLHKELRANKLEWRNLPDGEPRRELESRLAFDSTTMMALRDVGKFILGIEPTDDDGNPFGRPDDF